MRNRKIDALDIAIYSILGIGVIGFIGSLWVIQANVFMVTKGCGL